jgi:hypothetical protein
MSAQTPATHRPSTRPPHRTGAGHHMHVYRRAEKCWLWDCPCGGGVHGSAHSLPTQRAAFAAALNHSTGNPGN